MSSEKPILVVLGASGNQGGSVISHFLSLSPAPYALRGVTRDVSSSKAQSLVDLGVEMVNGDYDDPPSLVAAFKGASAIWTISDFWRNYASPVVHAEAAANGQSIVVASREHEAQQNRNIIDAAAKVDTLERFIFSSMPNSNKLSGGKYNVYHFDGKAMAEDYGRMTYPKLWEKTSVIYAAYYTENYFSYPGDMLRPTLSKDKSTLNLSYTEPFATTPLPMFSVHGDTGPLVHALLLAAPGKKLIAVNEWLTPRDFAKILAEVLGKDIKFTTDNSPVLDMGDPDLQKEYEDMLDFMIEYRYDGGNTDKSIVELADLGVDIKLVPMKEWCAKQDWAKMLKVE